MGSAVPEIAGSKRGIRLLILWADKRMNLVEKLMALALALVTSCPAFATIATPTTFKQVLLDAKSGEMIVLAPGIYDVVELKDRHWSPPVTVNATLAHLRRIQLFDVSGLSWRGGAFDGGGVERSGIGVTVGDNLIIDGTTMTGYARNGVGLGKVRDARVTNNVFTNMGSDGIDVALSRRVVLDRNRCENSVPTPGAHPDCIQMWSRPSDPPTADITITNNIATGATQGFTGFNHIRPDRDGKPVDDGGFDRIVIENNTAKVGYYHAISLYNCRKCIVRNNHVETMFNPDYPRVRAWIKIIDSDAIACGNTSKSFPGTVETQRCR